MFFFWGGGVAGAQRPPQRIQQLIQLFLRTLILTLEAQLTYNLKLSAVNYNYYTWLWVWKCILHVFIVDDQIQNSLISNEKIFVYIILCYNEMLKFYAHFLYF